MVGLCSFEGCSRTEKLTRDLCRKHYMRLYRTGNASTVRPAGLPGDGRTKHRMYRAWAGMINRCHNPNNSSYGRYGARGVVVCERWRNDFMAFLADMGERPEGMTLDRYPYPKGPYAPDNCRWATTKQQRANISPEGDMRMREAMSKGVKAYWEKWRADRAAAESLTW